jgi:hypothetical protein
MGKLTDWAKNHKGAVVAIASGFVGVIGTLVWGLLPEKEQPVKEEWVPPVKKNWYMESDD